MADDATSGTLTTTSPGSPKRLQWGTRFGFILAAAGSAVGLGNIWKFPYITGIYGGGAFVIVYLVCVLLVGLPLMIAELMIGRRAQQNPVGAFQKLHYEGSPWRFTGWLGVASGFLILSFYSVISGYVLAYIIKSFQGFAGSPDQIRSQFDVLEADPTMSILFHTIFMIMAIWIIAQGIQRGIEKFSKILMPLLLALLMALALHGLFNTEGGSEAISFLFRPDFSKLTAEAILSALGHAFFTLSLGMGAMITYGSYMKRDARIVRDAIVISFLDTAIALIAGIAIFSLVFAYGLEPDAGFGLIFKTLPVLFADTGPIIAVAFFVMLFWAALTSAISLLEVVVSYFIDKRNWSRIKATVIMGGVIYALGILSAVSAIKLPFRGEDTGFLEIFDFITTNWMLPIGGLLTCIFAAWVMNDLTRREEFGSSGFWYRALILTLKFVTPLAVLVTLLHGLKWLPFVDY